MCSVHPEYCHFALIRPMAEVELLMTSVNALPILFDLYLASVASYFGYKSSNIWTCNSSTHPATQNPSEPNNPFHAYNFHY